MIKSLILALALIVTPSVATTSKSTAGNPGFTKSTAQQEVAPVDNCADDFSSTIKNDMLGFQEGKASQVLDTFLIQPANIFAARGYCAALEAPIGGSVTVASIAEGLVKDLTTEAEKFGYKTTFTSPVTQVLGGNRIAIIVTPSADKIQASGQNFKVIQVFVFNKTRIVGLQLYIDSASLKTN